MWLPDAVALACQRNAKIPLGFQLIDEIDGGPVNLTGYSVSMAVSLGAGSTPITTIAGTLDDAMLGSFAITINGGAFGSVAGTQETVALAYDIKLTDGSGNGLIVMRGPLFLEPGVNA